MQLIKPNFLKFWFKSAFSIWILLFLVLALFFSIYDSRSSLIFIAIAGLIIIHSQLFSKKIRILDSGIIEISFLHGPKIISLEVEKVSEILLSRPFSTGLASWGIVFISKDKNIRKNIRVEFSYWSTSQLVEVYNQIQALLRNNKE